MPKFISKQGEIIKIIEYSNSHNCTIIFNDKDTVYNKGYEDIRKGRVRNPYFPSVWGIGFIGSGSYKASKGSKKYKVYETWNSMLGRCYNENFKEKHPSYKGCAVTEDWHNFQNFAKWFYENYKDGFALDKDILVKGNKIYSPETCAFVPHKINLLFVKGGKTRGDLPIGVRKDGNKYSSRIRLRGNKATHLGLFDTPEEAFLAYKIAKEKHIKNIADEWKDKIDLKVYDAMYNYKVEITD